MLCKESILGEEGSTCSKEKTNQVCLGVTGKEQGAGQQEGQDLYYTPLTGERLGMIVM